MEACPVCGLRTPLSLLEAHVNQHFDDPSEHSSRSQPDISSARCTICGASVPLPQLDDHERSHNSTPPRRGRTGGEGVSGCHSGVATAAAAPPSPSVSNDVVLVFDSASPLHARRPNGIVRNNAPQPTASAPFTSTLEPPGADLSHPTMALSAGATAKTVVAATLPSVICPYGCGQWIPFSELDSHELAHQMVGRPMGSGAVAAAGVAAAAASGSDGPGDEDWMQMGFDDTDYSYGDDAAMDDAMAADEETARRLQEEQDFEALQAKYGFSNKRPGRCFTCGQEGHWSVECPKRLGGRSHRPSAATIRLSILPGDLTRQQRPDPQSHRSGALFLVHMLRTSLESAQAPMLGSGAAATGYEAFLCCPLQHFGGTRADRGWGCGWRNIQMMSSALMLRDREVGVALYGGAGFVPDIASLQAWMECAWAAGFDRLGCESLGGKIQGDRKWIGTTEAAALLRSFGLRAHIVDFEGTGSGATTDAEAAAPGSLLYGPDGVSVHVAVECDLCGTCPLRGLRHRSLSRPNFDLCETCRASARPEVAAAAPYEETGRALAPEALETGAAAAAAGAGQNGPRPRQACNFPHHPQDDQQKQPSQVPHMHQPLVDWVWRYFSGQHQPTRHMWAPAAAVLLDQSAPTSVQTPLPDASTAPCAETGLAAGVFVGDRQVGSDSLAASLGTVVAAGSTGGATAAAAAAAAAVTTSGRPQLQLRSSPVTITGMPPLYFQHEGHSRTIIGIERRCERGSRVPVSTLLVLDPGAPSGALESALTQRRGWQRFIRRGLHTLTRPQYQLMYVDLSGLVRPGPELDRLKIIAAVEKHRAPVPAGWGRASSNATGS